ncbi:MAG: hypothetical protein UV12_C0015G0009 [Candidatus Nomurabacteria bacterium GW2011_GWC2_42_20]|uniref:Uncharacterized protein n=1 Tax=Candidatus Nomurabacteria bacterium GW2011_GWC2_42_20 TaxID=1618756 RepID=A0A0G0ZDW2_9BACT|nr:MAG: hypothetical protein UV12_C0015G0009 [Candidatus Nomurabacteria bacterium GW2011_GWC2_42_20]
MSGKNNYEICFFGLPNGFEWVFLNYERKLFCGHSLFFDTVFCWTVCSIDTRYLPLLLVRIWQQREHNIYRL